MNDTSGARLDPGHLIRLSTAYWGAQTLLTANRLEIFSRLADGPLPRDALAAALGADGRALALLLKACVALDLLEETADGIANSALSNAFLVPGRPGYMGNAIRYSDDLYATWGNLDQAVRDGAPQLAAAKYLGEETERTRHFVYGMHDRALGIGRALISLVDLSGRRQLLDIGGGPGTYSALFVQQTPGLRSRVLELPGVARIAAEILADLGVADCVEMLPGDYHTTEFPDGNNAVLISGVLHRETAATCRKLIARAAATLATGGLLVVSDVFTDAGGCSPAFATLFGLNMLLTAPDGGVHADSDVSGWMAEAGLIQIRREPFPPPMPHRVVTGVKA